MDEKDLKIIALRERIGTEAQRFAEEIAQLRVELTIKSKQVETLQEENRNILQGFMQDDAAEDEVVEGEVLNG